MSEKFTSDSLQKLQYFLTEMLREFDKICRDNDIDYFIYFGTELGAVRHKGFIPWDDDIDIGMMRTEFEKLKKVFEEQDTGNLFLGCPDGDYEWQEKVFPRLYYRGTVLESQTWEEDFVKNGDQYGKAINFDIFLFDYADDNTDKIIKKAKKIKWLYMYSKFKSRFIKNKGVSGFVFSVIKRLIYDIYHLDPDTSKKQFEKYLKLVTHEKSDYIICYDSLETPDITRSLIRYDQTFPTVDGMFDGIKVKLQKDYDAALKSLYGDYMQLPPEDKRIAHRPYRVSFGDFKFPSE